MERRVALVHTGAVVIGPTSQLARELLPGVTVVNYLDDRIVADLGAGRLESVRARLLHLVDAAVAGGAGIVMLTCSSINQQAGWLSERSGVPVLRIDEAMADEAVAIGGRIRVLATLPTTAEPTGALLRERAAGRDVTIESTVVPGAFDAVVGGDRHTHDQLVGRAIEEAAQHADVIVLAQASMAGAAEAVSVPVPVLTSILPGISRLAAQTRDLWQEG